VPIDESKNNRDSNGDSSSNTDEPSDLKRDDVSKSGRRGRDKDDPSDREDKDDKEGRSRRKDKRDGHRSPSPDDSPSPTRRRETPYYRKHWIKPKEFNGHTSFESFLVSCENAARFNEWNSKEKLAFLSASPTGPAVQLLWGDKKFTYKELVKELKEKFGATGMEERYQTELRCRRRREGETIRDLAQDIHRLMMHAYPGQCESELGQHIARVSFLVALNDPVLQVKVRERGNQEPLKKL